MIQQVITQYTSGKNTWETEGGGGGDTEKMAKMYSPMLEKPQANPLQSILIKWLGRIA